MKLKVRYLRSIFKFEMFKSIFVLSIGFKLWNERNWSTDCKREEFLDDFWIFMYLSRVK